MKASEHDVVVEWQIFPQLGFAVLAVVLAEVIEKKGGGDEK